MVKRSAAVVRHQCANPRLEHGSTTRFKAASAGQVPGDSGRPPGLAPLTSSMTAATPRSDSSPQTAATFPNARCRVRPGSIADSRACMAAAMSAAVPRYRSETIFGLPSTRAISRRYQYVFPLIFFGYRLATRLGHTST